MASKILGFGVLSPFRREGKDFVNGGDAALVQSCIENILGTQSAMPNGLSAGELPWQHTFGSRLGMLRHRNLGPTTDALAQFYVEEALRRWEPRVRVTEVVVKNDATTNMRSIDVQYRLITANVPSNRVVVDQTATVEI